MSTIRLTLNDSLEEIIQELEATYSTMSRTEILKMIIAEFYNARFSSYKKQKPKSNSQVKTQTINHWIETKLEPKLNKGEIEEVFGDWWSDNKSDLRN